MARAFTLQLRQLLTQNHEKGSDMLVGLRTGIHPTPDLAAAKAWYTKVLEAEPYFDQPFYVGFSLIRNVVARMHSGAYS